MNYSTFNTVYRVMLFKEAPVLLYTGLTEVIGKPREYEKNVEELSYFERD